MVAHALVWTFSSSFIMANIMPMKVNKQFNDKISAVLLHEQPLVVLTYYFFYFRHQNNKSALSEEKCANST